MWCAAMTELWTLQSLGRLPQQQEQAKAVRLFGASQVQLGHWEMLHSAGYTAGNMIVR